MFFLLPAVPAFLVTLAEIATAVTVARVVNDAYDAMKNDQKESDK